MHNGNIHTLYLIQTNLHLIYYNYCLHLINTNGIYFYSCSNIINVLSYISVHLLAPIDPTLSQYIEEKTRGQRESVLWQDLHKGRITSSVFGDILRAGGKPLSLIDRIMHGSGLER